MVYVVLGNGFEEIEALAAVDILRRGKVNLKTAGIGGRAITGAHNVTVSADITVDEINFDDMEMLVLPGGSEGVEAMEASPEVLKAVEFAFKNDRFIGAICAAPMLLGKMGYLDGKKAVCYPGLEDRMGGALVQQGVKAVRDGKLITGQAPAAAIDFALLLLETLTDSAMAKTVAHFLVRER